MEYWKVEAILVGSLDQVLLKWSHKLVVNINSLQFQIVLLYQQRVLNLNTYNVVFLLVH